MDIKIHIYENIVFQGDIINGISDAVSGGSEYDEPPYTLVATHNVGSNSVSLLYLRYSRILEDMYTLGSGVFT